MDLLPRFSRVPLVTRDRLMLVPSVNEVVRPLRSGTLEENNPSEREHISTSSVLGMGEVGVRRWEFLHCGLKVSLVENVTTMDTELNRM